MTNGQKTMPSSVRLRMVVWMVMLFGGALLGIFLDLKWFSQWFYNPYWHIFSALLGVLLLLTVFRISKVTGRTLARYGKKGDVPRFETNQLVTQGPYACMRHPMHLGLFFFPFSFALILGSPSFLLFIAPAELLFMLMMVLSFEEKEALEKFGGQYEEYRHRVPPFSLRPGCLVNLIKLKT